MSRTLWGQGPEDEGEAVGPAQPPSDKVDSPAQNDAASSAAPRPVRTTPGSGGLAALLMQNRAKSGRHRLDGEPAPVGDRTNQGSGNRGSGNRSSGSFDPLETTAVGEQPDPEAGPASGAVAVGAGSTQPERAATPAGGGVPVAFTRTQLGLGDSVRAALESARVPVPASLKPSRPLRPTPAGARSVDASAAAPTAVGSGAVDALRPSPPDTGTSDAAADSRAPLDDGGGRGVVGEPALLAETTAVGADLGASSVAQVQEEAAPGVVASGAVSGAVTGPVAAIGSGPVFDPLSGPITNVSPVPVASLVEAAAPRPGRRPTPASGRLAALLAESRKKTGRHQTLEGAGAGGTPAPVTLSPSGPVAFTPVPVVARSEASSPAVTSAAEDTTTVRVPGAAVAEKKVPAFAATLMGLPAPTVATDAASGAATAWGPGRLRDSGLNSGANRNSPLHVDGDATEPSNMAPDDLTASATGWRRRRTTERKRITDVIDVVRPPKHRGATVALIVSATMIAAIVVVFVARGRRPSVPAGPAADRPAATAVESPRAEPPPSSERAAASREAPAVAGDSAPVTGAPTELPSRAEVPADPALAGPIPPVREREEAKAEQAPPPPTAAENSASAATVAAEQPREEPRRPASRDTEGESKPKASREGTRRAAAAEVTAAAKVRRSSERRARTHGTTVAGTAFEPARPRVGQPSRMVPSDPDATLPLAPQ